MIGDDKPTASVIVPIYKVQSYICECIDSILKQTFEKFGLFLIDDGSSDCCGEICDEYALTDQRICVIHQPNAGVSMARNAGLSISIGRYVVFCDGDDYVKRNYLADLLCQSDKIDLVFSGVLTVDNEGKESPKFVFDPINVHEITIDTILDLMKMGALNYAVARRYKREIIENATILFDRNLSYAEDTLFLAKYIVCSKSLNCISKVAYCYREDDRCTLSSFNPSLFFRGKEANQKIASILDNQYGTISNSSEWHFFRQWRLFYYSLNKVLNCENSTFWKKRQLVNSYIESMDDLFFNHIESYAKGDGILFQKILKTKSGFLIVLFHAGYHRIKQ